MVQVRYLGIFVGDAVDPAALRSDPKLGLFVPATEPMPVGTLVDFDGATVVVLRVEEGTAPGFWLRSDAVPRANTDHVITARTTEISAAPATAAESVAENTEADSDKADGDKPGGDRKRRRRANTSVGR